MMVYFLGDWGMGDAKYATCNHVSKISNHEQSIHTINLQSPISNDVTSTTDQTEVLATNAVIVTTTSAPVTKLLQTVITVNNNEIRPSIINTSDILFDGNIKNDQRYHQAETQGDQVQHQLKQQQSLQLNQQTLTLTRATELIRQRSSSIHQIQYDERLIHHYSSQQDYDDEVAVHPLSNQVRIIFIAYNKYQTFHHAVCFS